MPTQDRPEPITTDFSPPGPETPRISLLDLTPETCRWPMGDVGDADFGFCGQGILPCSPYCGYHSRIAYTRPVSAPRAPYVPARSAR